MNFHYVGIEDLEKIHEATLVILETIGVRSKSQRFLDKAASLGLKVQDGTIYFPREKVAEALGTAPSHFSTYGRDETKEIKWGKAGPITTPASARPS